MNFKLPIVYKQECLTKVSTNPDATVFELKEKIHCVTKIPSKFQILTFAGTFLHDDECLYLHGISPRDHVHLNFLNNCLPEFKVHVRLPSKNLLKLSVRANMTVGEAKQLIEDQAGVPKRAQSLFIDPCGEELGDGKWLASYGIGPKASLLMLRSCQRKKERKCGSDDESTSSKSESGSDRGSDSSSSSSESD